jgi:hypothetical protein
MKHKNLPCHGCLSLPLCIGSNRSTLERKCRILWRYITEWENEYNTIFCSLFTELKLGQNRIVYFSNSSYHSEWLKKRKQRFKFLEEGKF